MYRIFLFLSFLLISLEAKALIKEILKVKEIVPLSLIKEIKDTTNEFKDVLKLENDFEILSKEVKSLSDSLEVLEEAGVFVEDLKDLSSLKEGSFRDKIRFLKNYKKRAESLTSFLSQILSSSETIIASQTIETNRSLRALIKDLQHKEIRDLRREIKRRGEEIRKRELKNKFIKSQYSMIKKHQKRSGFHTFYPFKKKEIKRKKNKGFFRWFK